MPSFIALPCRAKIPFPPAPLPRRHIFWREEMSDGASKEDGICAGGAIAMVPIIVVFIAFQKFFINGMAGAVKG